jgi:hypothetical protein
MNQVQAFQCEICKHIDTDSNMLQDHESECIREFEYNKKKTNAQDAARAYLDSFRGRVSSVKGLLNLIETESDSIVDSINTLEFYDTDKSAHGICHLQFEKHGFNSSNNLGQMRPTHSSPIGKNQVPQWPRENPEINYSAFEVRISYDIVRKENSVSFINILDFIGGINTGTGGSGGHTDGSYYVTFWMDDFPNGLTD